MSWLEDLMSQIAQNGADAVPSDPATDSNFNPAKDSQSASSLFGALFDGGNPTTENTPPPSDSSAPDYTTAAADSQRANALFGISPHSTSSSDGGPISSIAKLLGLKSDSSGNIDYSNPKTIDALMKLVMAGGAIMQHSSTPQGFKTAAQMRAEMVGPYNSWTPQQQASASAFFNTPMRTGANQTQIYAADMKNPIVPGRGYADGGVVTPFSQSSPSYAAYGTPLASGPLSMTGSLSNVGSSPGGASSSDASLISAGVQSPSLQDPASPPPQPSYPPGRPQQSYADRFPAAAVTQSLFNSRPSGRPGNMLSRYFGGNRDAATSALDLFNTQGLQAAQQAIAAYQAANPQSYHPGPMPPAGRPGPRAFANGGQVAMMPPQGMPPGGMGGHPQLPIGARGGLMGGPLSMPTPGVQTMPSGQPVSMGSFGGPGVQAMPPSGHIMPPPGRQNYNFDPTRGAYLAAQRAANGGNAAPWAPSGGDMPSGYTSPTPGMGGSQVPGSAIYGGPPPNMGPGLPIQPMPGMSSPPSQPGMQMQGTVGALPGMNTPPMQPGSQMQGVTPAMPGLPVPPKAPGTQATFARGGRTPGGQAMGAFGHVMAQTGGQDDVVPATLPNGKPAALAGGEYVMDADAVSALGDGNNAAGAKKLDEFRKNLRAHKRSAPADKIPPKAKPIAHYMGGGRG